ncbi:MAG: cytochrome c [Planctomycetes bacterium]|nr:cytochrome c [Planctomycetota bacterium]
MPRTHAFLSLGLLAFGCAPADDAPAAREKAAPPGMERLRRLDVPALHNLLKVSPRIYCGGEPRGDEAFASLGRLGVKIIVSVDGARPDVDAARPHGLRYVHIPIGYDGIEQQAELALAHVVRSADGPIYFHCHQGRHRGPAAAAVAALAAGDVDAEGAEQILHLAGTSTGYAALWRDVAAYVPPAADAWFPELVEVAELDSLTAGMAAIHRAFDHLRLCLDAGWKSPPEHPDLIPAQEALLLKEGLRESSRHLPAETGEQFRGWLVEAERDANALRAALAAERLAEAASRFTSLEGQCQRCHVKYRD